MLLYSHKLMGEIHVDICSLQQGAWQTLMEPQSYQPIANQPFNDTLIGVTTITYDIFHYVPLNELHTPHMSLLKENCFPETLWSTALRSLPLHSPHSLSSLIALHVLGSFLCHIVSAKSPMTKINWLLQKHLCQNL